MDLTNRALIIGGALIWIFVVFVVILLAWGAPDESIEQLGDLARYLEDHNDTAAKLIVTFGGLILALLAVIVILYEVAPPQTGSLKLAKIGGGEARIATDEIARRLEEDLRTMPQMSDVQVAVQGRGQKAEVKLELHVGAEADLAAMADEACRRASHVLEQQMGLALARPPQAQLHYRELRVGRPGEAQASSASSPPAGEPSNPSGSQPMSPEGTASASGTTEPTDETPETHQEDRPAGV